MKGIVSGSVQAPSERSLGKRSGMEAWPAPDLSSARAERQLGEQPTRSAQGWPTLHWRSETVDTEDSGPSAYPERSLAAQSGVGPAFIGER